MSHIRDKTIEGLKPSDRFVVKRTFSDQDVIDFAAVSRDYNPVHFDDRFAQAKNIDGRICHGLLVGSILTEIGGQIGWLASEMSFRFKKPVFSGDEIECEITIKSIDDKQWAKGAAVFRNQHGQVVLEATVDGIIPGRKERQVLQAMVAEGDPTNKVRR